MDASITQCVLARARSFMGSMLPKDGEFGNPQLVRYSPGQKFDQHTDWMAKRQTAEVKQPDGTTVEKSWNRIASFFVFVRARC
jgi:prolyl 4-hydroxylase